MMHDQDLQKRFLRELPNRRLAHIASDLIRIHSSLRYPSAMRVVPNMLRECKFFCEWASVESVRSDVEIAFVLLTLQRQLVRWEHHFDEIYADPVRRAEMAETARAWSNHLLVLSGLLTQGKQTAQAAS